MSELLDRKESSKEAKEWLILEKKRLEYEIIFLKQKLTICNISIEDLKVIVMEQSSMLNKNVGGIKEHFMKPAALCELECFVKDIQECNEKSSKSLEQLNLTLINNISENLGINGNLEHADQEGNGNLEHADQEGTAYSETSCQSKHLSKLPTFPRTNRFPINDVDKQPTKRTITHGTASGKESSEGLTKSKTNSLRSDIKSLMSDNESVRQTLSEYRTRLKSLSQSLDEANAIIMLKDAEIGRIHNDHLSCQRILQVKDQLLNERKSSHEKAIRVLHTQEEELMQLRDDLKVTTLKLVDCERERIGLVEIESLLVKQRDEAIERAENYANRMVEVQSLLSELQKTQSITKEKVPETMLTVATLGTSTPVVSSRDLDGTEKLLEKLNNFRENRQLVMGNLEQVKSSLDGRWVALSAHLQMEIERNKSLLTQIGELQDETRSCRALAKNAVDRLEREMAAHRSTRSQLAAVNEELQCSQFEVDSLHKQLDKELAEKKRIEAEKHDQEKNLTAVDVSRQQQAEKLPPWMSVCRVAALETKLQQVQQERDELEWQCEAVLLENEQLSKGCSETGSRETSQELRLVEDLVLVKAEADSLRQQLQQTKEEKRALVQGMQQLTATSKEASHELETMHAMYNEQIRKVRDLRKELDNKLICAVCRESEAKLQDLSRKLTDMTEDRDVLLSYVESFRNKYTDLGLRMEDKERQLEQLQRLLAESEIRVQHAQPVAHHSSDHSSGNSSGQIQSQNTSFESSSDSSDTSRGQPAVGIEDTDSHPDELSDCTQDLVASSAVLGERFASHAEKYGDTELLTLKSKCLELQKSLRAKEGIIKCLYQELAKVRFSGVNQIIDSSNQLKDDVRQVPTGTGKVGPAGLFSE